MMNSADKIYRSVHNGITHPPATRTEAKAASGNSSSKLEQFDEVMLPHLKAAHNHARWLTRNEHDASDVSQESYLRAFRFFNSFQGGDPKAWLLAIVRNTHLTWLRREEAARRASVEFHEETHFETAGEPDAEERLIKAETAGMLNDCIKTLEPEYREVLVMCEFEDMSYREIASVAGLPIGTVMSRLSRARQQLRERVRFADLDAISPAV